MGATHTRTYYWKECLLRSHILPILLLVAFPSLKSKRCMHFQVMEWSFRATPIDQGLSFVHTAMTRNKPLTTNVFTLIWSAEVVVVPFTSTIDEPLAATSGDIVAKGGDGGTARASRDGLQAVTEARALFFRHTPVPQSHCPWWTLAALWRERERERERERVVDRGKDR